MNPAIPPNMTAKIILFQNPMIVTKIKIIIIAIKIISKLKMNSPLMKFHIVVDVVNNKNIYYSTCTN